MHQVNPFIQHAVRHGQEFLHESGRAAVISQDLITICDEAIMNINSGNTRDALSSVHNARNMAVEINQSARQLNETISERMQMASFILGRIQHNLNELSTAMQSLQTFRYDYPGAGFRQEWWSYANVPYNPSAPVM